MYIRVNTYVFTCKADDFLIHMISNWMAILLLQFLWSTPHMQKTSLKKLCTYIPEMETLKSLIAVVGKTELITTSHSYTLPISLRFSDGHKTENGFFM